MAKKIKRHKMRLGIALGLICFLLITNSAEAHQPRIVKSRGEVLVENPEVSQAFYGQLAGQPAIYLIDQSEPFLLYLNLLSPKSSNPNGRFSANVYQVKQVTATTTENTLINQLLAEKGEWVEFYEPFGADYYLKGPEWEKQVEPGLYQIEVYNQNNQGKYVLAVGKQEKFGLKDIIKTYWDLPRLKISFFNVSPFTLLKSPLVNIPLVLFLIALFTIAFIIRRKKRLQPFQPSSQE